jgi:two-component system nitrogen regulation response regulator NtrX
MKMDNSIEGGKTVSERILIIDDEPKIGQMISDILRDEGYEPIIALDAERGLESTRKNDLGLVLLDLKLPDKDGLDVLKEIAALKPNLPVVIISAHGNIKTAVQTTKMGAFDFIEKPLDMDRLLITVRNALAQVRLKDEVSRLRSETLKEYQMIGTSPAMQKIYDLIDKAAGVKSSVLVTGANGTGKELAAKAVHYNSPRQEKPFIKINCAAVPETLLESELFGYEKGAFTGASGTKKGKLEQAEGGTVFLDEIGDMSVSLQAKLLRFLQDGEIQPLGGAQTKTVDARVIAASNQNLDLAVKERRFREDLFYRLNVIQIRMPPLKERREDIPLLVRHFMEEFCRENGVTEKTLSDAAMYQLINLDWPGNVRQVRNIVERLVVLSPRQTIEPVDLEAVLAMDKEEIVEEPGTGPLEEARHKFEKGHILKTLTQTQWSVPKAAEMLGMDRTNLYRKMKQLGIVIKTG